MHFGVFELKSLSDAERDLAGNWYGFAKAYSRKFPPPPGIDRDDWESECMRALCYTVTKWEPSRGRTFTSYYYLVMKSRYCQLRKLYGPQKLQRMTKASSQLGTRDLACLERHGESISVEKLDYPEQARKYLLLLEGQDRIIVSKRILGDSYDEISESIGVAPCKVKNLYNRAIQKIRNKVL